MSIESAQSLMEKETRTEWLVEEILPTTSLTLLAGESGAGTTMLAMDLALGMVTDGEAWGGRKVQKGNVLYCCRSVTKNLVRKRLGELCRGRGTGAPEGLDFEFDLLPLWNMEYMGSLMADIFKRDYKLVVFDALNQYLPGMNDASQQNVNPVMKNLRYLAEATGIMAVQHLGKRQTDGDLRAGHIQGTNALVTMSDTVLGLRKRRVRRMQVIKSLYGGLTGELAFDLTKTDDGGVRVLTHGELTAEEMEDAASLVDRATEAMFSHLMQNRDSSFNRLQLERVITQKLGFIGKRTVDEAMRLLLSMPGLDCEWYDHRKYYYISMSELKGSELMDIVHPILALEDFGEMSRQLKSVIKRIRAGEFGK